MILGYKLALPGKDDYWFGKVGGHDRKFRRVIAGVALPLLDRINGAVVVVGELYRSFGPIDLTGLAATVGPWGEVEAGLGKLRADLKFGNLICEEEAYIDTLMGIKVLQWGLGEVPCIPDCAPKEAFTEIGRSKIDQLLGEGRLHKELIEDILRNEPDMAVRALMCAVMWAYRYPAQYAQNRAAVKKPERVFGTIGL